MPLAGCWPGHIVQDDGRRRGKAECLDPIPRYAEAQYQRHCTPANKQRPGPSAPVERRASPPACDGGSPSNRTRRALTCGS